MTRGIIISNYLVTGDPEGVIFAYISNWTGQAIKISRNLFPDARDFNELKRPGIYFLIGQDESNPDDKIVYVGQANHLADRIVQHLKDADKSFAEIIICLSSKDENLSVAHTQYLEQKTIMNLGASNEFRLLNKKDGNLISLSRMAQDEMDTYYDNMKVLLPTLGYNLLHVGAQIQNEGILTGMESLKLEVGEIKATARLTSNGIQVLSGSEMNMKETPSLSGSYSNQRKTLVEKQIVVEKNGKYVFPVKYEFPSPSTAAAILLGYSINGRTAWKNHSGKTLKEIEDYKIR